MKLRTFGRAAAHAAAVLVLVSLVACHNAPRDDGSGGSTGNGDSWFVSGYYSEGPGGYGPGGYGPCGNNGGLDRCAPQGLGTPQSRRYYTNGR